MWIVRYVVSGGEVGRVSFRKGGCYDNDYSGEE